MSTEDLNKGRPPKGKPQNLWTHEELIAEKAWLRANFTPPKVDPRQEGFAHACRSRDTNTRYRGFDE